MFKWNWWLKQQKLLTLNYLCQLFYHIIISLQSWSRPMRHVHKIGLVLVHNFKLGQTRFDWTIVSSLLCNTLGFAGCYRMLELGLLCSFLFSHFFGRVNVPAAGLNVLKMQNLKKFSQGVHSSPCLGMAVSSASPNTAAVLAYLCVHSNDTFETKTNWKPSQVISPYK